MEQLMDRRQELFLAAVIRKFGRPIGVDGEEAYTLELDFNECSDTAGSKIIPADANGKIVYNVIFNATWL